MIAKDPESKKYLTENEKIPAIRPKIMWPIICKYGSCCSKGLFKETDEDDIMPVREKRNEMKPYSKDTLVTNTRSFKTDLFSINFFLIVMDKKLIVGRHYVVHEGQPHLTRNLFSQ